MTEPSTASEKHPGATDDHVPARAGGAGNSEGRVNDEPPVPHRRPRRWSRLFGMALLILLPTFLCSYVAYFGGASSVIGTELLRTVSSRGVEANVDQLEDRYVRAFLMANIAEQELAHAGFDANKRVLEWYLVREQASFWFVQGGSLIILLFGLLIYVRSVEEPSAPNQHAFEAGVGPASIKIKTRSLGIATVLLSLGTVCMNAYFSKSATVKINTTEGSGLVTNTKGDTLNVFTRPLREVKFDVSDLAGSAGASPTVNPSSSEVVDALKSQSVITDANLVEQLSNAVNAE